MSSSHQLKYDQKSERERIVRQNRIDLVGENCKLTIRDREYEIIDCSPFGLCFKSKELFLANNSFTDCKITYNGFFVNEVSLRIVREEKVDNYSKIACEVLTQPIEVEKIIGIRSASSIVNSHREETNKFAALPEDFRRVIYDMKVWLISLREKVNSIDSKNQFNKHSDLQAHENNIANVVGSYIVESFEPIYIELHKKMNSYNEEVRKLAFDFFRSQMIEILLAAPFHNRAFNKPLGYAGDYQMMNQIYAFEGMGDSLFSKCLHLYFISAPESRAVRNRANYLYKQISNTYKLKQDAEMVDILSVASGPAFEMQNFIRQNKAHLSNIHFHLLDQDLEALQHAQRKIKSLETDLEVKINFTLIHKPIKHVIARGLEGKYDLIYSAGLFDYFTDPVAQMAGTRLFDSLKSNSKLIIGNFSSDSLGQLTMDIALDWHLIYRSEDDLAGLFSKIPNKFYIESEEEGINLFCHLDKK